MDTDGDRILQWKNREIIHFVTEFFCSLHLTAPSCPDTVWYQLYREIDTGNVQALNRAHIARFVHLILIRTISLCEEEEDYGINSERGCLENLEDYVKEMVIGEEDTLNGRYWESYAEPDILAILEANVKLDPVDVNVEAKCVGTDQAV